MMATSEARWRDVHRRWERLKEEGYSYVATSRGYRVDVNGQFICAAGIHDKESGPRGRKAMEQALANIEQAALRAERHRLCQTPTDRLPAG